MLEKILILLSIIINQLFALQKKMAFPIMHILNIIGQTIIFISIQVFIQMMQPDTPQLYLLEDIGKYRMQTLKFVLVPTIAELTLLPLKTNRL